jgi:peroxiredoxin
MLLLSSSVVLFSQSKIPNIQVKTLEGKSVSINDYIRDGKPTIISFWATWCSPCKRELDAIKEVYSEWEDKYGVQLVAVTIDDARSLTKVRPMVEEKNWKYIILSDANRDLMKSLNVTTVPHSFLLDGSGNIVWIHNGYTAGDEFELEEQIKELMNKD